MRISKFVQKYTFEQRRKTALEMLQKYPDRVPIICEPAPRPNIDITKYTKTKYLVPKDATIGKFLLSIRENLFITPDMAIYIFVDGSILPPTSARIEDIYNKHKSADEFLYVIFCGESAFGST